MKRFVVPLFALLAFVPVAAFASGPGTFHSVDLQFHTSLGDAYTYSQGDSLYASRGSGIRNSDERVDTTKVFAWQDWCFPGQLYNTTVAADTFGVVMLTLYPEGTSITVSADTLDLIMQVSFDNENTWVTVPHTGPAISPDVATMGAAAILEVGTANVFKYAIRAQLGGAVNGGPFNINSTCTANQTYGLKVRFLLRGDFTGKYRAKLTGWRCI